MGQYLSLPGNMRPDLVSFDSVLIELVLNISLRTPFDCQHQISGWEFFLHGLDEAIRVFGFFERFFKNQQVSFSKVYGRRCVKRGSTLAMPRNNNSRFQLSDC